MYNLNDHHTLDVQSHLKLNEAEQQKNGGRTYR